MPPYPEALPSFRKLALAVVGACCLTLGGCGRDLPDFAAIDDVAQMKQAFYDFLQPVVAQENARILAQREELKAIRAQLAAGEQPGWMDRRSLRALAEEYEVTWDGDDPAAVAERLWRRVDIIPADLALVQAAKESGWGRSRFAVEINNLFGHWCFERGCGVVPDRRPASATHEVAAFDSVLDSVRRYMNNLNTHVRYVKLRSLRAQRRSSGKPVTGTALAPGLLGYSERGQSYVEEILSMLRRSEELLDDVAAT